MSINMSDSKWLNKINRSIRHAFVAFGKEHFAYPAYAIANAKQVYHLGTGKELNYRKVSDFNEKLFWLARYWQHPLIVKCADKLAVRDYVKECGLDFLLNEIYAEYDTAESIDLGILPERFVLKCNHGCGFNIICKDKSSMELNDVKAKVDKWLHTSIGIETAEYQYQHIQPRAYAERYIGDENDERWEIQFFCFNGTARHILLRNDLGDSSAKPFAISYTRDWKRVRERKHEDMSIDVEKPANLETLISYAECLARPFPNVRVDFYLVGGKAIFGELTFSTSGNILHNYTSSVVKQWGSELVLPEKLNTKWCKDFKIMNR